MYTSFFLIFFYFGSCPTGAYYGVPESDSAAESGHHDEVRHSNDSFS